MEALQPGMGRVNHEPGGPAAAWFAGSTGWLGDEILWPPNLFYLPMNAQGEFDFGNQSPGEGYTRWLAQRKLALRELARQINLPLDHQVEVWLVGGIRLRGKLQLREERLFLEKDDAQQLGLLVDHVPFSIHEMESCVRLD